MFLNFKQSILEVTVDGKSNVLAWQFPVPFGADPKPPKYLDNITALPKALTTVFVIPFCLNSRASKEIKAWRTEIKKAKHKNPNVILVGTPPTKGESKLTPFEALEVAVKQKASEYCEVDTKSWQGLQTLWEKIVFASQTETRPSLKKRFEEEKEKKRMEVIQEKAEEKKAAKELKELKDQKRENRASTIVPRPLKPKAAATNVVDMVRDTITELLEK